MLLTCKLSHEVASRVDRDKRGEPEYWELWRKTEMLKYRGWNWREELSYTPLNREVGSARSRCISDGP